MMSTPTLGRVINQITLVALLWALPLMPFNDVSPFSPFLYPEPQSRELAFQFLYQGRDSELGR